MWPASVPLFSLSRLTTPATAHYHCIIITSKKSQASANKISAGKHSRCQT